MNNEIATGHLVRCISIADAISGIGGDVTFVLADNTPEKMLRDKGYKSIVLNSDWKNMESELEVLENIIWSNKVDYLLIDSYQITKDYLSALGKVVKTMYIDDLNLGTYSVDSLVCYAIYWEKLSYPERYNKDQLLLGCKYAPLRNEFFDLPNRDIKEDIENILVLSGGTDHNNIIQRIVEKLLEYGDFNIDAVCGIMNPNYEVLRQKFSGYKNVIIHRSLSDIYKYMLTADLVISAGGTTLYELCACGTPVISYSVADNQLENTRCFHDKDLIKCLGDVRYTDIENNIDKYLDEYREYSFRVNVSKKMQNLIDGKGALRIAKVLMGYNSDC